MTFSIDWDVNVSEVSSTSEPRSHFELQIGEQYDCRMIHGGSHSGHASFNYVISQPLPDNTSGLELTFIEYSKPFSDKKTGTKIVFRL